jgi:hypothetical protein
MNAPKGKYVAKICPKCKDPLEYTGAFNHPTAFQISETYICRSCNEMICVTYLPVRIQRVPVPPLYTEEEQPIGETYGHERKSTQD